MIRTASRSPTSSTGTRSAARGASRPTPTVRRPARPRSRRRGLGCGALPAVTSGNHLPPHLTARTNACSTPPPRLHHLLLPVYLPGQGRGGQLAAHPQEWPAEADHAPLWCAARVAGAAMRGSHVYSSLHKGAADLARRRHSIPCVSPTPPSPAPAPALQRSTRPRHPRRQLDAAAGGARGLSAAWPTARPSCRYG